MTPDRAVFAFVVALLVAGLALWAATARAQNAPPYMFAGDVLTIQDGMDAGTAVVNYGNSAGLTSQGGAHNLTAPNGIATRCKIEVNAVEGAERIACTAPDGFLAYPVEADVQDGDEVQIIIMPIGAGMS